MTAFIFDLDGTLIRSEALFFNAAEAMFNAMGHSLTELSPQERSRIPGRSAAENMAFYLEKFNLTGDPEQMARDRLSVLIQDLNKNGVPVIAGAENFLKQSRAMGIPCALATSSPYSYAQAVFRATGLDAYFNHVITGDAITRYKPDPEIFLKAASLLNVSPESCIVFEDAHAGFLAARAANMGLVALPSPMTLPSQQQIADLFIQDFKGITPSQVFHAVKTGSSPLF